MLCYYTAAAMYMYYATDYYIQAEQQQTAKFGKKWTEIITSIDLNYPEFLLCFISFRFDIDHYDKNKHLL